MSFYFGIYGSIFSNPSNTWRKGKKGNSSEIL